jgi:hypothetical protein
MDPSLKIGPLKIEIHSWVSPYAYEIHEYVGSRLAGELRAYMNPRRMERAEIHIEASDPPVFISPMRTSSIFFFENQSDPLKLVMDRKAEVGTGLNLQHGIGYYGQELLSLGIPQGRH